MNETISKKEARMETASKLAATINVVVGLALFVGSLINPEAWISLCEGMNVDPLLLILSVTLETIIVMIIYYRVLQDKHRSHSSHVK